MHLPQFYPLFLSLLGLALGGYSPWVAALPATEFDPAVGISPASPAASVEPLRESRVTTAALVQVDDSTPEGEMSQLEYGEDYNTEAIDYFTEIAFGVEYGSFAPALHRWANDVRIRVHGAPTDADIYTLNQVIAELNQLTSGITLSITKEEPEIEVYFVPESRFSTIEPQYVLDNLGFFRVWWNNQGVIHQARILIVSEGVTQQERAHLIREELTQSLGLFQDSWKYPESIFYQGWTATNEYAPIDRAAIRLLYSPQLRPGMTLSQARAALLAHHKLEALD